MECKPLLALDFGTSTLRALVSAADGRVLASAQAPVSYFTPDGLSSLAREFRPDEVVSTLARLVRSAPEQYWWVHRRWKGEPPRKRSRPPAAVPGAGATGDVRRPAA